MSMTALKDWIRQRTGEHHEHLEPVILSSAEEMWRLVNSTETSANDNMAPEPSQ